MFRNHPFKFAVCLLLIAAFGLGLIEPTHQLAAQEVPACSANTEHRI